MTESTTASPAAPPRTLPSGSAWWWGTGRRKSAIARVRIRPGSGKIMVNERELDQFFTELRDRQNVRNVLERTSTAGAVDVHVHVRGGGYMGQAGAIILGLGRALKRYDPSLDSVLRQNGYLTRDSREVERKKYGQAGARRRFQFSKR
jgi:small subunit ribosomal protein S9